MLFKQALHILHCYTLHSYNFCRAVRIYTRFGDLDRISRDVCWGSHIAAVAGDGQVEGGGPASTGRTHSAEGELAPGAGMSAGREGWGAAAGSGQCAVRVQGWLWPLHGGQQGHLGLSTGLSQEASSSGTGKCWLERRQCHITFFTHWLSACHLSVTIIM